MKIETLQDAFIHELSDIHNAEKQLTKALPKMAKAASNKQLAEAFEKHLKETEGQIELIDKVIKSADIHLKREKCDAMEGLIKEGQDIIKEVDEGPVRDVLLIAAAQKVEHYEIASYGCLVAVAKQLGLTEAAKYLEQILEQEKQTDQKLNQLAEQGINEEASQASGQEGDTMAGYEKQSTGGRRGQIPERDEQGRFMSSDDRDYDRDYDYEDDRRYARSSRYEDYDDDDRYYSSSSRGYDEDYDDDRYRPEGRGHGRGGWFGDPEGHAEAARRGSRSSYRTSQRDDRYYDDNRSSSRSRDYDDDRGSRSGYSSRSSSRGSGRGWFGDPEGHARAGRHSHDNIRSGGNR